MKNNIKWKRLSDNNPQSLEELKKILLENRNLDDPEDTKYDLREILKNPDSIGFEKDDVLKAAEIIKKVLNDKKGVILHGDYDVDGITSTAILYESLIGLGFSEEQVSLFLPNRFDHGYGFNEKSFEEIKNKYPSDDFPVIILVDCGISSIKQIEEAKKEGYKVILIDHHQRKKKTPSADCIFWNDSLTASVLTYFFTKYLEIKVKGNTDLLKGIDLAGLGYVCDLGDLSLPLGRTVTKEGIKVLSKNPREGIKILLDKANRDYRKLSSYDLGWVVGPRLNSSGRMSDPLKSLNLLIKDDSSIINSLASELNSTNSNRQAVTKEMYEEAVLGLSNKKFSGAEEGHRLIVAHSSNFHEGVIGLISSRLVKSFNKPSVCISWDNGVGKGSCRSVVGVNIIKALDYASDFLEGYGGHEQAAGFSIQKENFEDFENKLLEYGEKHIDDEHLVPSLPYDSEVRVDHLNLDLLNFIEDLEPFGNGNPSPKFVLRNTFLDAFKILGKEGKHLSFRLKENDLRAIFFNGEKYLKGLTNKDAYDLLFSFEKNEWKGNTYPQLVIKDIKPAEF